MPTLIHSHLNYFGDAEYGFTHAINTIKRIRKELDPSFVPLFRKQVYRYEDGSTKTFKNFGFGVGLSGMVGQWRDPDLEDAEKPTYGYMAKLERAGRVSLWLPTDNNRDGTPGHTDPPDVWWFYLIQRSQNYKKQLAAESIAKIQGKGNLDYWAQREHYGRKDKASAKMLADLKAERAKDFAPDRRKINQHIRDLTTSEFNQFKAEQKGLVKKDKKPFVSLGT